MSREKQIEEMAKVLCGMSRECAKCKLNGKCLARNSADVLYTAGYRKQIEGEWLVCGMFDDFFKCSCCGDKNPWQTAIEFKLCPNCGAKMTRKEDYGNENLRNL